MISADTIKKYVGKRVILHLNTFSYPLYIGEIESLSKGEEDLSFKGFPTGGTTLYFPSNLKELSDNYHLNLKEIDDKHKPINEFAIGLENIVSVSEIK